MHTIATGEFELCWEEPSAGEADVDMVAENNED